MAKLYINIHSVYQKKDDSNYLTWNREIAKDSETINAVFNARCYVKVDIPIQAGKKYHSKAIEDLVVSCTAGIRGLPLEDCHIILNTHGASGCCDLQDEVIKTLIQKLSEYHIAVSQITALLCNGLKSRVPAEGVAMGAMFSFHRPASFFKPASMQILQGKLCHLVTAIPQRFLIRGFDKPYDPIADQCEVADLLRGVGGRTLPVETKIEEKKVSYALIRKDIKACSIKYSELKTAAQKDAYEKASSVLGRLFGEMSRNVQGFLSGEGALNQENKSFYRAVLSYAEIKGKPSVENFRLAYERWKKEVKLFDARKQQVLLDYCDAMDPSMIAATGARCLSSDSHLGKIESMALSFIAVRKCGLFSEGSVHLEDTTRTHPYSPGAIVLYHPLFET